MRLSEMVNARVVHALLVGFPGAGKTGSIASLANAGYRVFVLDFDLNPDPFFEFVEPECRDNVTIASFHDRKELKKFSVKGKLVERFVPVEGMPLSYSRAIKQLNEWIPDLGPRDVVVIDSLTRLGDACMLRILAMQDRLSAGPRIQDWGTAQEQQLSFLTQVREECAKTNVLVTAHLKVIEPKAVGELMDLLDDSSNESSERALKEAMEKSISLVPTKFYPSALGRALPQDIGSHFPYILRYDLKEGVGGRVSRVISTQTSSVFDVKVPLKGVKESYPIETGLKEIFDLAREGSVDD